MRTGNIDQNCCRRFSWPFSFSKTNTATLGWIHWLPADHRSEATPSMVGDRMGDPTYVFV